MPRTLVAIPVYNEQQYIPRVIAKVLQFTDDVLVIDDGSTDATPSLLATFEVEVIRHAANRGYGRSLQDAFLWASTYRYDWLITMDCDEQHEPAAIPRFIESLESGDADVISGSRYLADLPDNDQPPADRRGVNREITEEINARLALDLTDGFCGFKAYRVPSLERICLDVDGYDFPMQFWVRAVAAGLRIEELPVRLIYNDPTRTFGGPLDQTAVRLQHYRQTLHREILRCRDRLPEPAARDLVESASGVPQPSGCSAGCRS